MPPGWHVTTGPGLLLYPGANGDAAGNFLGVKNGLRVDVTATTVTTSVNGAQVAAVPRQDVGADGRFGFRVGNDMNLHITT